MNNQMNKRHPDENRNNSNLETIKTLVDGHWQSPINIVSLFLSISHSSNLVDVTTSQRKETSVTVFAVHTTKNNSTNFAGMTVGEDLPYCAGNHLMKS